LQLPERQKLDFWAAVRANDPRMLGHSAALGRAHLELVAAVSAPNGRPAPADESVVKFVFGPATFALNIHRLFSTPAARGAHTYRAARVVWASASSCALEAEVRSIARFGVAPTYTGRSSLSIQRGKLARVRAHSIFRNRRI
jgi:hypothetical protein